MEDIDQVNNSKLNNGEGEDISKAFLRLKEHGKYSRTRALRLKENDVIVAVDGDLFHVSSDNLTDIFDFTLDLLSLFAIIKFTSNSFFSISPSTIPKSKPCFL